MHRFQQRLHLVTLLLIDKETRSFSSSMPKILTLTC